jgi:hypothetical protein
MRRNLWISVLGAAALLLALGASPAWAGKGSGSSSAPSGRSYGSGSGGRSFSPSGRSYGSGSQSSSPSFSGKSNPSAGRGSTPAVTPTPGGRTYSSGGTGSRPGASTPGPTSPAAGGKTAPVSPPSASGRSYGSAGSLPPSRAAAPSGRSYGSAGGGFDSAAAAAQKREVSRAQYTKGKAPEPTYQDPKGEVHPINPTDRRVEELRSQLDYERWSNWQLRQRQFYGDYYSRPVIVYHDPYSSPFWWWLLAQSADTRAAWYYNHRQSIDEARYQELLARDAELKIRMQRLEAQGPPNPAAAPAGVPPDLMYTQDYVNSVYNPKPAPPAVVAHRAHAFSFWHGVRVLLYALLIVALLAVLVWLVFFKRWGATPR